MASANVANTLVVPLETKVAPFYDDFDENKNYHRILFRPGYAVQARELTQLQTIMQNQIERFGRHIFVNGSSVIGGQVDLTDIITLNLNTQYANADVVVANFKDKTIKYASGNNDVIAKVLQVSAGDATTPPALHVKYISGLEFGPGSTITTTTGNISANLVATSNASSNGVVSFIYDSIFFYNGYFIKVPTQSTVLSKHDRTPTTRVGLELQDSIVTESDDTSLLDPALEASNYQAPGSARYKADLVYTTRSLVSTDDEKFIELAKVEDGVITQRTATPLYSEIENVLARRTYDESGNYIVKPFILTVEESTTDPANNFLLKISSGKAYLFGYETERQSETRIELPRARSKANTLNYDLNLNYGNYVIVEDLQGVFNTQGLGIVDMHCVAQSEVSFANTTMYNATKIGTARVRDIEFYSGSSNVATRKFEYYFFDTKFRTITGTAASLANSNTEIVLQKNNTSTSANAYAGAYIKVNSGLASGDIREIASYDGPNNRATVYQAFTQTTGANTQYTITFDITDVDAFVQNTVYTTGATSNATVTIAGESKDTGELTGNTFINEPNRPYNYFVLPNRYVAPGITNESYVYRKIYTGVQFIGGDSSVITASTDENFLGATGGNTASTVMENFLVIVTDKQSSSRVAGEQVKVSAVVTTSTPEQVTLATGGGASDSFLATVYAKVTAQDSAAQPRVKTLVKANTLTLTSDVVSNVFIGSTGSKANVYVNAGQVVILNPSKESSIIESLYLSDVIAIPKIYAFTGNAAPSPGTSLKQFLDVTDRYEFDNGQRLTHYDHAAIRLKPGYAPINGGLIVCTRGYKTTNDVGYFSIDSYPSLDTLVTEEGVTLGTGYNLIPKYQSVRLSDVIDFRPVRSSATNTENFTFGSSRAPVPATDFRSDFQYYLPRRDLISLSLNKEIELIQGESKINPVFPKEPDRNLTLQRLSLNPYTLTVKDVVVENLDHRRYTMKDIANIDKRLKNVEYSVSLNSLEKKATDIVIQDVDGLDRTKYGILADSFNSHLLADASAVDYSAAVDTTGKYSGGEGMLMPKLYGNHFDLAANTYTAQSVSYHDDKVMLAYTTTPAISQVFATKTTAVAEYLFADFRGQLVTFPDSDIWKNTTVLDPYVVELPPPPPPPPNVVTPPPPKPPKPPRPPKPPPDVVINGNVDGGDGGGGGGGGGGDGGGGGGGGLITPAYEMLMALTNSSNYFGLGTLQYDPATGTYYVDDKTLQTVNGVVQTAGLTYEQAANYVEAVLADLKGSTVNITADNVKFIAEVYNDLLNRPPEGAGLTYWAELYATGNYTKQQMYQLIVDGAIAANELTWVTLPDPNTTTYSLTPSTVILDFNYSIAAGLNTTTYDNLSNPNYTDLLADHGGTRFNTAEEVINDLYQSYLGREGEAEGLDYWVGVYNEFGAETAINSFYDAADINIDAGLESSAGTSFDPVTGYDEGSYSAPEVSSDYY